MTGYAIVVTICTSGDSCSAWLLPPWGAEYAQQRRSQRRSESRVFAMTVLDNLSVGFDPRREVFDMSGCPVLSIADLLRRLDITVRMSGR